MLDQGLLIVLHAVISFRGLVIVYSESYGTMLAVSVATL